MENRPHVTNFTTFKLLFETGKFENSVDHAPQQKQYKISRLSEN